MKKIREKITEQSKTYWNRTTATPFLTFLSSKLAGINTSHAVHVGQQEDEHFINEFLVENGKYYNPCSNNYPENQKEWFKTIWQYRYKPEKVYSQAFNSSVSGLYTFSDNYIELTKEHALRGKEVSLAHVITWLYRSRSFEDTEELIEIKRQFIAELNITKEELGSLFLDDISGFQKIFAVKTDLGSENKELSTEKTDLDEQSELVTSESLRDMSKILEDLRNVKPTDSDKIEIHGKVYKRDNKTIAQLKIVRGHKCQICGTAIKMKDGTFYVEAAHITPKKHMGNELPSNIALLCPNHHKEFDLGKKEILERNEKVLVVILNEVEYSIDLQL
jgi:gamma-glutamylcyclotransferase (GGCT)/AIG2-like uncharacterized protein YtfP